MTRKSINDLPSFEAEVESINQKLDEIEVELSKNLEILESIEIDIMLLKTELDFETDNF